MAELGGGESRLPFLQSSFSVLCSVLFLKLGVLEFTRRYTEASFPGGVARRNSKEGERALNVVEILEMFKDASPNPYQATSPEIDNAHSMTSVSSRRYPLSCFTLSGRQIIFFAL